MAAAANSSAEAERDDNKKDNEVKISEHREEIVQAAEGYLKRQARLAAEGKLPESSQPLEEKEINALKGIYQIIVLGKEEYRGRVFQNPINLSNLPGEPLYVQIKQDGQVIPAKKDALAKEQTTTALQIIAITGVAENGQLICVTDGTSITVPQTVLLQAQAIAETQNLTSGLAKLNPAAKEVVEAYLSIFTKDNLNGQKIKKDSLESVGREAGLISAQALRNLVDAKLPPTPNNGASGGDQQSSPQETETNQKRVKLTKLLKDKFFATADDVAAIITELSDKDKIIHQTNTLREELGSKKKILAHLQSQQEQTPSTVLATQITQLSGEIANLEQALKIAEEVEGMVADPASMRNMLAQVFAVLESNDSSAVDRMRIEEFIARGDLEGLMEEILNQYGKNLPPEVQEKINQIRSLLEKLGENAMPFAMIILFLIINSALQGAKNTT